MTGAGSPTVAVVKEDGFRTLPGTPSYFLPGRNITFDEISLGNALQRMRSPTNEEAVDSIATNLEGALSASWVVSQDTHTNVRDLVFNDGGTGFTSGLANTSRWYLGLNYSTGGAVATVERELEGVIPLDYSIQYTQGGVIRASMTMGYAAEGNATSITPGTISGPTDGGDVPFHGANFSIDTSAQTKLQSATLSFSNLYRYHDGASRYPVDAVLAAPEVSLEATSTFSETDQLELAYGSSGATSTEDSLTNVAGEVSFDVDGSTVATYTLPKMKCDTHNWNSLVDAESDAAEQTSWHANGGISVA